MAGPTQGQARLRALEAKVLADAAGDWLASIKQIKLDLVGESPDIRKRVLALVAPKVESKALAAVVEAFHVGQVESVRVLIEQGHIKEADKLKALLTKSSRKGPSKRAADMVRGLDKQTADAIATTRRLLDAGAELDAALAPTFAAANAINRAVTSSVHAAGNDAANDLAEIAELPTVWVAEVDACVECLAYSGRTSDPGEQFPGGLSYGKSYNPDPLDAPPLHPNCRCTVEPLGDQSYADALRREADRSVLRGFSLESEPMSVRIKAADKLLASNPNAPASVIAYAEKAVGAGKFPVRGRP